MVLLVAAPGALAQVTQSTNWAGYAVHHRGIRFRTVSGTWREPSASCQKGRQTFSSYWVGLGGYTVGARALEQTGTDVDCTSSGRIRAFAWYEVVPSPSVPVRLAVPPGDLIQGQVSVGGHTVRVTLRDLTRHTEFEKVLTTSPIDVSSAEWIVEAPSDCLSLYDCVTLPLADFGSTAFASASAQTTTGHSGPISDPLWHATAIRLVPHRTPAFLGGRRLGAPGEAAPSQLLGRGSAFSVSYSPLRTKAIKLAGRARRLPGRLVHLGLVPFWPR